MAFDWNTYYTEAKRTQTPSLEEQIRRLKEGEDSELNALDIRKEHSKNELDASRNEANKAAYVTRMQAERYLPQQLAARGITGGATETEISRMFTNYLKARNAANSSYNKSLGDLLSQYNSGAAEIKANYANKRAAATAATDQETINLANTLMRIAMENEAMNANSRGGGGGGGGGYSRSGTSNNPAPSTGKYNGGSDPYASFNRKIVKIIPISNGINEYIWDDGKRTYTRNYS